MARGGEDPGYSFEFIAAPADLTPYLNSFYFFETEAERVEDAIPAYSGQLVLVLQGKCTIGFTDGERAGTDEAAFLAPLTQAHRFVVEGPCLILGASINFRGWAAITGLAVDQHCDEVLPLDAVLSPAGVDALRKLVADWRAGKMKRTALPAALAIILRAEVKPLPDRTAQAIDTTLEWLSSSFRPDLDDLYARFAVSRRSVQRLVARLFGQTPVHLARRYRAVRAATVLATPGIGEEMVAQLREAFYDQAHMIKEIRHFTGRTPRHLDSAIDTPLTRSLDAEGYSAVDPFGGGEARQLGKDA